MRATEHGRVMRGSHSKSLIEPGGPIESDFSDLYDVSLEVPIKLCYACR